MLTAAMAKRGPGCSASCSAFLCFGAALWSQSNQPSRDFEPRRFCFLGIKQAFFDLTVDLFELVAINLNVKLRTPFTGAAGPHQRYQQRGQTQRCENCKYKPDQHGSHFCIKLADSIHVIAAISRPKVSQAFVQMSQIRGAAKSAMVMSFPISWNYSALDWERKGRQIPE